VSCNKKPTPFSQILHLPGQFGCDSFISSSVIEELVHSVGVGNLSSAGPAQIGSLGSLGRQMESMGAKVDDGRYLDP
jgi:hypothetical protein